MFHGVFEYDAIKRFSEREREFTFAICRRALVVVRLSVCLFVVCNVCAPYSDY